MKIYIMRGISGSGKSTWISENVWNKNTIICSADDYHMVDGVYSYRRENVQYAHNECYKKFANTVVSSYSRQINLVCDNTNITLLQVCPYVRLVESFGVEYKIVTCLCNPQTAINRGIHQVPTNVVMEMHWRLSTEIVPLYWKHEIALTE